MLNCHVRQTLFLVHIYTTYSMEERKFRKLLDKYIDGSISEKGKDVLGEFEQGLKSKDDKPYFKSGVEKRSTKKSLWTNINDQINVSSRKEKLKIWRIAASVAALFIVFIAISGLYMQNAKSSTSDINPGNAITLQLEDGSVKIIEDNGTAKITDKNGTVLGRQTGNQLVYNETNRGEALVYNTITIPYGKTFNLQLSDGTLAHLNAGSSLKYPVKFLKGRKRQIFISGEIYLNVAKDSLRPFIANTNNLNVRVLGTQFNISAYPEDMTTDVVLVEGSVSLYSETDGFDTEKNTVLKPGFKGSYDRERNEFTTNRVSTEIYTSWMNGKLIFRNMTFENILKKLERHYNVTIKDENTELSKKKFNANFGSETIQNVLKELKINYGIDYEFTDDHTILIK